MLHDDVTYFEALEVLGEAEFAVMATERMKIESKRRQVFAMVEREN